MKRVCVTTLGCRLNQFESDALERLLAQGGYRIVAPAEPADIHILNTCTITHQADAEARALVGKLHAASPATRLVLTGCYATGAAEAAARLPGVALVVDNAAKADMLRHLAALTSAPNADAAPHLACGTPHSRVLTDALPVNPSPRRSRVYLKVQDGCDYRCAFCIVPAVRGKSRSLPPDTLRQQLLELVAAQVPEVVITGVHLGTYGRDLAPRLNLQQLLESMLPHLGLTRLRLSSLDPHEVTPGLIELMAAHPEQLCPYLHLPVQSCDNAILKRMRRAHTVEDLVSLVPRLRAAIPDIALGSDVIVGFPSEDTAAFDNTHRILTDLHLSYLHVFSYSKRAGTDAALMAEQVPAPEIARRSRVLRSLSAVQKRAFASQFVGRELPAVVHRQRHLGSQKLVAITHNYIRVLFEGPDLLLGRAVRIRLSNFSGEFAAGELA